MDEFIGAEEAEAPFGGDGVRARTSTAFKVKDEKDKEAVVDMLPLLSAPPALPLLSAPPWIGSINGDRFEHNRMTIRYGVDTTAGRYLRPANVQRTQETN